MLKKILLLIISITLLSSLGFAEHTSTVSIDPELTGTMMTVEFTVTITNTGGDGINEVKITPPTEYSALSCSDVNGWALSAENLFCTYITTSDYITLNASKSFTITTTTPEDGGEYAWEIRTKDVFDGFVLHNPKTKVDGTPPTINDSTLVAPNGGENWPEGSRQEIKWNVEDITDDNLGNKPISLYYKTNGEEWVLIEKDLENDGSYSWIVPPTATKTARVKLVATDLLGNSASDESDSDFIISLGPVTATIGIDESVGIDVNRDGKDDFIITLKDIVDSKAVLTFEELAGIEEIGELTPELHPLVLLIIVIIIIVIIIYLLARR